ncbi:unnamed protein product, partial [Brassica napus]
SSRDFLCGSYKWQATVTVTRNILGRGGFGKVERVVEGEEARDVGGTRSSNELEQVIQVALLCTQGSPMETTKDVRLFVRMLEGDGLA